jgi:hypothetical protein
MEIDDGEILKTQQTSSQVNTHDPASFSPDGTSSGPHKDSDGVDPLADMQFDSETPKPAHGPVEW